MSWERNRSERLHLDTNRRTLLSGDTFFSCVGEKCHEPFTSTDINRLTLMSRISVLLWRGFFESDFFFFLLWWKHQKAKLVLVCILNIKKSEKVIHMSGFKGIPTFFTNKQHNMYTLNLVISYSNQKKTRFIVWRFNVPTKGLFYVAQLAFKWSSDIKAIFYGSERLLITGLHCARNLINKQNTYVCLHVILIVGTYVVRYLFRVSNSTVFQGTCWLGFSTQPFH